MEIRINFACYLVSFGLAWQMTSLLTTLEIIELWGMI
jgi:hypothetical protein